MKIQHIGMFMDMAEVAARQSRANRLKVGCIVVRDNRILSVGYNGTPPGLDNKCEGEDGLTKREVIHAEMNAIYKMARDGEAGKDAVMFITHAPCFECSKAILSVGIKRVYYGEPYRDVSGVRLLADNGVMVSIW
jgi:dCMP deaminase